MTALHEAGHAVAAWALGFPPLAVDILHVGERLGCTLHDGDGDSTAPAALKKEAVVCYSGKAAEGRERRVRSWREAFAEVDGDCDDREIAADILSAFPDALSRSERYQRLAFWLVGRRWAKVEEVASALLTYSHLDGQQMDVLLEDGRDALEEFRTMFLAR